MHFPLILKVLSANMWKCCACCLNWVAFLPHSQTTLYLNIGYSLNSSMVERAWLRKLFGAQVETTFKVRHSHSTHSTLTYKIERPKSSRFSFSSSARAQLRVGGLACALDIQRVANVSALSRRRNLGLMQRRTNWKCVAEMYMGLLSEEELCKC